jgi:hypothetical protein
VTVLNGYAVACCSGGGGVIIIFTFVEQEENSEDSASAVLWLCIVTILRFFEKKGKDFVVS